MKRHFNPLATILAAILQLFTLHPSRFTAHASVPLSWDVRPGQPAPVMFDRYHGETLGFSATFRGFGELPFAADVDVRLWYQTNGMGQAWWSVPATVQSNVLSATWSPALDPGTDRVSLFFGAPSNAYAAAVLRLRHSPGFAPGTMPDPIAFHESDPKFTAWLSSFQESDPVFSSWLEGYTPPDTSLEPSTNYTDRALGAFAETGAVARARSYGTPTRWVDSTGCVWEAPNGWTVYTNGVVAAGWLTYDYSADSGPEGNYVQLRIRPTEEAEENGYPVTAANFPEGVTPFWNNDYETLYNSDVDFYGLTYGDTIRVKRGETNLVGRVALTNDIPAAPDLSPIEQDISDLRTESALVYRLYSGSNVVAEVTNYNSQVHAPELRLMQLNESNEYITVWTETNGLARTLASATKYTDDATGAVARAAAPRAWSRTTSGLGEEAPSNTTWISTEKLVIASGQEYVSVDSAGVWVLCANGQVDFTTKTNSYFSISTETGEPVFCVERSDSRPIPVYSGGIRVDDSGGSVVVTIPVPVFDATENRNDPPFLSVSTDLSGPWYSETNSIPSSLVTSCTWSGQNGAWTNTVVMAPSHPVAFFSYAKWQAGGMVIRNKASMEVSQGIIVNGQKFVPVINGSTLTWQAQ